MGEEVECIMNNAFEEMDVYTPKNQLSAQQQAQAPSVAGHAESSRAVAEVQASLVIARANPRDEVRVRDRLFQACERVNMAASAIYEYQRGGMKVSGPSIRLAEVAARCWGNMNYGFRELDRRDGVSEVEAYAWDLETNTKVVRQFAVKHIRDTRQGGKRLTGERDIYEMVASQAQRRVRACVLEILPGDMIEQAVTKCEKTLLAALPEGKDMADTIKAMVEAFKKFGVDRKSIGNRLGHHLTPDATTPSEIVGLQKIWMSLNDGMSDPSDWFDVQKENQDMDDLNDKILKPQGESQGTMQAEETSTNEEAAPSESKESPPTQTSRKRATPAMREDAKQAYTDAGGDVSELETEFGAYVQDWTYKQCGEATMRAAILQEQASEGENMSDDDYYATLEADLNALDRDDILNWAKEQGLNANPSYATAKMVFDLVLQVRDRNEKQQAEEK